jgi:hypothetical protein
MLASQNLKKQQNQAILLTFFYFLSVIALPAGGHDG